jgi:hypothetical protein
LYGNVCLIALRNRDNLETVMTVGVPPSGVVTIRKDSNPSDAALGCGGGRPRWRTWRSWRPKPQGRRLVLGTWVGGIRLLKGDSEIQTNREPSGRALCKVGHRSSLLLVLFVSQTTMVQRRLSQKTVLRSFWIPSSYVAAIVFPCL